MRAGSLFVLLTFLTAAGIVAARPSVVLPIVRTYALWTIAATTSAIAVAEPAHKINVPEPMAGAASSQGSEISSSADRSEVKLPSFVPGAANLVFGAKAGAESAGQSAAGPEDAKTEALQSATASLQPASSSSAASDPPRQVEAVTGEKEPTPFVLSVEPIPPRDGSANSATAAIAASASTLAPPPIPAKALFGAATTAAPLASRAIGTYSRGCLAGAVALPVDGPAWQAMRLSRNRNWGHPKLVALVERLALDAQKHDNWPGLLVGDISQPRGGPMLTGHASHQVGLDADVWLTPMPTKRLTRKEREEISATSMLDQTDLAVDPKIFTEQHVKLIKRAASYPEVERVLVHPAIKKALCEAAGTDRKWLGKVRPIGGHYYHFHIRIGCPPGSTVCKPQVPPTGDDGCGKEVQEWLARLAPPKGPPPPKPPGYKPPPPAPPITMAQLPKECSAVLESGPDGVRQPLTAIKDDVPMGGLGEAKAGAFVAGTALRPHITSLKAAEKSD